jgi:hypothetical protein
MMAGGFSHQQRQPCGYDATTSRQAGPAMAF